MTPSGQTVCLCMIVKNEAPVIRRCLDSLRTLIDHWVIVDTGSTDGTQGIVRDHLRDVPGALVERPWRDFAHNRSEALALARPHGTYSLIIDADDTFEVPADFCLPDLDADSYTVDIHFGGSRYQRPQLVKAALGWRYEGVIHEYLACDGASTQRHLPVVMHIHSDGARRRDPQTYTKDSAVLERAVTEEADSFKLSRYTFYLAQSYRDSGQRRRAIDMYLRRAEMGHWEQEVFVSLLNAGRLMAEEGEATEAVLQVLERATAAVPERNEALHAGARLCRERGEYARGLELAARGLGLPQPKSGLFVESWAYEVGLLDEYAVNASWVVRDMDALVACSILLARPLLDEGTRGRIRDNRDGVYERLAAQSSLWVGTLSEDRAPRVAIVTPYYKETPETLRRCIDSVKGQTVKVDHILIADGHPQDWIDGEVARHLRLDRATRDFGDTPRGIGAMLAASGDYAAVSFLDADCWYEQDHVEACLTAALANGFAETRIVSASRTLRRTDLSVMPLADDSPDVFIDTNCYFMLPRSFGLLAAWVLSPRPLKSVGDRLFFLIARTGGHLTARTHHATVNYVTTWASSYRAVGEPPPLPVKENPDHHGIRAWIEALKPGDVETLRWQLGIDVRNLYDADFRGAPSIAQTSSPAIAEAEQLFAQGKIAQSQARLRSSGYDERTKIRYAAAMCRITRARRDFGPPSLVWRCDDRSMFEIDWVRESLKGVDYVDASDDGDDPKNAHLIVCDNRLTPEKLEFYVDRAARGSRVHLIHLSDEWASDDTACYEVCATVFRNQWSPAHDDLKHVVTFPLGYKRGYRVHPADRASADRPLLWSFAGHGRSEARRAMLEALDHTKPHRTHLSSGFDSADGLAQDDYRKLLERSLFAPCPSGFSTPDTFRFCEALEAGCIPIVERGAECDYYKSWLGQHPVLVVRAWSEAPGLIKRVLTSGQGERLRQTCMSWWDATKRHNRILFASRIQGSIQRQTDDDLV